MPLEEFNGWFAYFQVDQERTDERRRRNARKK